MTIPAPWSLPPAIKARILTELKVTAALGTVSPLDVGKGDSLRRDILRQWIVQQRFIPEARIGGR